MENNTQNKSRFFAQYFETDTTVLYKGVMPNACWGRLCHEDLNEILLGDDKEFSLLLTPLRNISDEDAIEVAKICCPKWIRYIPTRKVPDSIIVSVDNDDRGFRDSVLIFRDGTVRIPESNSTEAGNIVDYLRSKSYALPYCGVTVE